jgi:xanthine dehydrogenase accessory factor
VEAHAMPCASNGALELFIQPTVPAPNVLILGSTPTALEACVLAQRVGFRVSAAAQASGPFAALGLQRVVQGFAADAIALLAPQLIVVATQGDGDEDALEAALRSGAAAVLLVASQRKAEHLRDAMLMRGVTPQRLDALHAPAGPAIHAQTPQEIALGAVAGLVTLRREWQRQKQSVAVTASSQVAHGEVVPALPPCESMTSVSALQDATPAARYRNPVCGMSVDVATAKHVVTFGGERVYFCCDGCKTEFQRAPEKYVAVAHHDRHEGASDARSDHE